MTRQLFLAKTLREALSLRALILVFLVAAAGVHLATAQDVYKVNYFSNNNAPGAPDATVRIDNPGLTYGNVCAMIYVFAADQQMAEYCGCVQSHNNLTTYSVGSNLASPFFTLTAPPVPNGVIKIVSAPYSGTCDPTSAYKPTGNLRAWGTHIQNRVGSAYPITETEFSDSTLGATELTNLQTECLYVNLLGSGFGACQCGTVE
jgi:hypothetical protein